ncbi:MAG: HTTM domain-containing protein [Pseudomonadota bacterium]
MIGRWVALWDRREAPTSLAITRLLVGLVLLFDLAQAKYTHAVEAAWSGPPLGLAWGSQNTPQPFVAAWFGASPRTAEWLWWLALSCCVLFLCGALFRVSALLLSVILFQIGRFEPDADAIDQLLRIALPILALSGAHACCSVDAWWAHKRGQPLCTSVPAWPRYLLILQLLWLYFSAAHNRSDAAWYPWGGFSAVSNVLGDPHFARFPPGTFQGAYHLTQLGTAATMLFEGSAPLMLLWFWRGSRVRWVWLALGVALHLGIAITMQLGIFPFGMLALYPVFVHPEELSNAILRLRLRRGA